MVLAYKEALLFTFPFFCSTSVYAALAFWEGGSHPFVSLRLGLRQSFTESLMCYRTVLGYSLIGQCDNALAISFCPPPFSSGLANKKAVLKFW